MNGNDIRDTFLNYFEKYNHRIVRSSSLVPADDPTLLFTNAGMVQFKRAFLGEEKRPYNRAVTSQKCVRAGGKHNDLENVGYTARHHTFFEMLGNFSFGDYFKEKAIEFCWDLLTNGYGLPAERLWVSIYLDDDEAYDLWHKNIGVPADRIVRLGESENFWAMGDTGPCGPCSEVHLDRGPDPSCPQPDKCGVDCDCDRFLEIWNLVFMQFNRDVSGAMTPLPKPSIDTGLGLERLASVLQNVATNYDTDLMMPIMRKAEALSGVAMGSSAQADVAMKVIADHSRAAAFLIGDGVLPSNEGRGYVLRRIMRRAIRYGRNIGLTRPFLHHTARVVADIMESAYPDLKQAEAFITNVIKNEESRFSETLDHGLRLLNDSLSEIQAAGKNEVPGDIIFKLYDTYGFPVDIVRDVVRDRDMRLDMDGFERNMTRQREQSRAKVAFDGIGEAYKHLSAEGVKTEFVGYDTLTATSEILLMVKDGQAVSQADAGDAVEIVVAHTPFYAESGGQVGDAGKMIGDGVEFEIDITDTVKDPTGLIIHKGQVISGTPAVGHAVALKVDAQRRQRTACNHTATHILHAALRHVLGDHVKQAGSMVSPDRLRFDFTHFSRLSTDEWQRIEDFVNARVRRNADVNITEMAAEDAFKSGATALFEEKYGDRVRVIALADFSRELCGGTHTSRAGNIGLFVILSEASIASGVRRIEALTGAAAVAHIQQNAEWLNQCANMLKDAPAQAPPRLERLLKEHRQLEKQVEQLKAQMAAQALDHIESDVQTIDGVKLLAKRVTVDAPAQLRDMLDRLKNKIGSGIVVLGAELDEKALLIVGVTPDLVNRFHAGRLVKQLAAEVGGGGGGRPDMAQAGGSQPQHLDAALGKAADWVAAAG